MQISAVDVQQKTFRERFRGYDPDDVEEFLDTVVETLRSHEVQARILQERIDELERELAGSREAEDAIKRTFIAAQRTSQEILGEAQDKSARLLERARTESDELVRSAHAESASIRERAGRENEDLNRRLAQLRATVSDLQGRLRRVSESAALELETMGASIDLETESIADLLGAAAARQSEPVNVPEEPVAPSGEIAQPAPPPASDAESREVAYLQQPRNQRPWDRPEGP